MQESQHEREGIDDEKYRVPIGLVGLAALLLVASDWLEALLFTLGNGARPVSLFDWIVVVSPVGWGGLVYACWIRPGRITDNALGFVLALGACGMTISVFALDAQGSIAPERIPVVFLTGIWIMNGLGIVWIAQKVRRFRADEADAAR